MNKGAFAEKRRSKLGTPSASITSKAATLESLDADALVQKLTERINQLLAAESNIRSKEEQCADRSAQPE